jgi:hypothetical protein
MFASSSFVVQAVMAPVSHLLVYYVTDSGEPISDVISFDVKLLLRQVKYQFDYPTVLFISLPCFQSVNVQTRHIQSG